MSVSTAINPRSAFDLNNQRAYEDWRDKKLHNYPDKAEQLIVEINDPMQLTKAEHQAIKERCNKANMAIYISKAGSNPDKQIALQLARQFALYKLDHNMGADDDGITSLQVSHTEGREHYIPYTRRAIHWHTDGYYNSLNRQVHALCLHCVRPAWEGGENALLDHEVAYIRLRDKNPEHIHALMQSEAMSIPANMNKGVVIRPERCGPVFSVRNNNTLHMRYTERTHNINWFKDSATQAAVAALEQLLHSDDPAIYRCTLQPGQGLISNNVLHDRSVFIDEKTSTRLLYRLRYFNALNLD
ncbi:hypothetical protein MNBD_GAMMA11-3172 [hydrothermal vent metagenome]|uniref:TauD/TfdA-like domain-containing protein n=1 Tax=hydrothermal vent metagenome TaxID=652676 RepID=A0A3B0XGT8_9ZZZZ